MFGFSIAKLIFTVVIIAAVWYGFKWLDRLGKVRRGELDASRRSGGAGARPVEGTQDMVKCSVCGIFVAAEGTGDCGRGDCPYRG